MFRIKICGITNVNDALAAAEAGADAIGLNFYKQSRRFVEPDVARQISSDLPRGVLRVGVFVNHTAVVIGEITAQVKLDCVQLHGDEHPGLLSQLPSNVKVIRAHRCGAEGLADLSTFLSECRNSGRLPDAVLVDADSQSQYGGTGRVADWARVAGERELLAGLPLFLAGGLTPENVGAAIAAVSPDGVDVASGVELQPGKKDRLLVDRFVTNAKQAFSGR